MPPASPKISVLLPLRNVAATLEECLRSLLAQSFGDFEVIAIDDGSTDRTAEAFGATVGGDRRFRLVSAWGRGLVAALNQAASLAQARWLARMDGDDLCEPSRFELQWELAEHQPQFAAIGSLVRVFPRPLRAGMDRYEAWLNSLRTPEQISEHRFVESPLAHPSVLLRRDAFEHAGRYVDRGWPEDYDLWLRLLQLGHQLAKVPEVLLHWRDLSGRTSRTSPTYGVEAFRACKLHYLRSSYPLRAGCALLGAGPVGKAWARLLRAERIPVRCFVEVHPRRIGRSIGGLPVIGYERVPSLGPLTLLAAVGRNGAREQIVEHFRTHPLRPGQRLVLVA